MAPVLRSAVESLHGILTPEQRVDFAEALQSRVYGITRAAMSSDNLDEFATKMNLTNAQDEAIRAIVKQLKQGLVRSARTCTRPSRRFVVIRSRSSSSCP